MSNNAYFKYPGQPFFRSSELKRSPLIPSNTTLSQREVIISRKGP